MADDRDAKVFQVLRRQVRKNRLVYLVLAECGLILSEAQAPQPDHDVHRGAPQSIVVSIICGGRESVQTCRRRAWFDHSGLRNG